MCGAPRWFANKLVEISWLSVMLKVHKINTDSIGRNSSCMLKNQCLSVLWMGSFSSSVKDGGIYGQYQLEVVNPVLSLQCFLFWFSFSCKMILITRHGHVVLLSEVVVSESLPISNDLIWMICVMWLHDTGEIFHRYSRRKSIMRFLGSSRNSFWPTNIYSTGFCQWSPPDLSVYVIMY